MAKTDHQDGQTDLPVYSPSDFVVPGDARQCDMIMKGGITSGIVYSYAILELARRYRLRSIGGASAGAIAAAFAAAAEYARRNGDAGGYVRLQQRSRQLPAIMPRLFQPEPAHAPLWYLVIAAMSRNGGIMRRLLPQVLQVAGFAALAGVLIGVGCYLAEQSGAVILLAGLLAALTALLGGLWIASGPVRRTLTSLRDTDFGLCSGMTQSGEDAPGLTEWMHEALQYIAFGDTPNRRPLTFGDLDGVDGEPLSIELRMVTTNLSMRRPVTLPFLPESAYDPQEWASLFPQDVLTYLASNSRAQERWHPGSGLHLMPDAAQLPVIVAVRMSLSFPLLFRAVPLHQPDVGRALIGRFLQMPQVADEPDGSRASLPTVRMLYSDGGISSNFPVHFFDAPLPTRPTFAISLAGLPADLDSGGNRVIVPTGSQDGRVAPASPIDSLAAFGWSIISSAKDWQDQLLSEIPGQRERIATVFLASNEGGLNLAMSSARSTKLMQFGQIAGERIGTVFSWDEHLWRRSLIFAEAHGQLSEKLVATYDGVAPGGFAQWFAGYAFASGTPLSYKVPASVKREIGNYVDACAAQARANLPHGRPSHDRLPKVRVRYRVRPDV